MRIYGKNLATNLKKVHASFKSFRLQPLSHTQLFLLCTISPSFLVDSVMQKYIGKVEYQPLKACVRILIRCVIPVSNYHQRSYRLTFHQVSW